jgi:hypothetical protein
MLSLKRHCLYVLPFLLLSPSVAHPQNKAAVPPPQNKAVVTLKDVKKIFVEPMPNGFDQYLIAAIIKELSGRISIVTSKDDAEAILTGGVNKEADGTPSTVARRLMGMDLTTGAIRLLPKDGKTILWASEAGDKSIFLVPYRRTGQRKVAERLAKDLRTAIENSSP